MKYLRGRFNRATYWAMVALAVLMVFALGALGLLNNASVPGEIVIVLCCVPRLHDLGRSGWWISGVFIFELVGVAAGLSAGFATGFSEDSAVVLEIIGGLVGLMFLAVVTLLGVLPGQKEPNRFGPPPPPGVNFGRPKES